MADATNYPDVLGFLTENVRLDLGVIQAAAGVRPKIVRAGRPFQVVVLLQNATDAEVEVTVTVEVPSTDMARQKARFILKTHRVAVGVAGSEVGVLTFPVNSLPDTTPSKDYHVQVQVTAKLLGKSTRIRLPQGGGAFYLEGLPREQQTEIAKYHGLHYVAGKKSLLAASAMLEPGFGITAGELGQVVNMAPEYKSLWKRKDLREDPRILMEKHLALLTQYLLPSLDRTRMLVPLVEATEKRFGEAGYDLRPIEAEMIGRVMTLILEFACTGQLSYGRTYVTPREYEVLPIINMAPRDRLPIARPYWLIAMLEAIDEDERAARFAGKFVPEVAYDALLHDALVYGLHTFEAATGSELGAAEELEEHAQRWMEKWRTKSEKLKFEDVYFPLVITGIIIHEDMNLPDLDVKLLHPAFQRMLPARKDQVTAQNYQLFSAARDQLEKTLMKYGLGLLSEDHLGD